MAKYATPIHTLTVNGTNLYEEFGVYTSGEKLNKIPEKDYELIEIPGTSGDFVFASTAKRIKNITLTYPCFILEKYNEKEKKMETFTELMTKLQDFFMELPDGYVMIEDTYHPDEYRMGTFVGIIDPQVGDSLDAGSFELSFDCEPKRYTF